jgi:hypothetical protein
VSALTVRGISVSRQPRGSPPTPINHAALTVALIAAIVVLAIVAL